MGCTAKNSAVTKASRQSLNTALSQVYISTRVTRQCRITFTAWKYKGFIPASKMFNLKLKTRAITRLGQLWDSRTTCKCSKLCFLPDLQSANVSAIKLISENCSELLVYLIKEKTTSPIFLLKYAVDFGKLHNMGMGEDYAPALRQVCYTEAIDVLPSIH